jgi:hypothetical protein
MIISNIIGKLSPMVLSVLLIIYLMIIELGNKKMKKALLAYVIALMAIFAVIVFQNIAGKW